MTELSEFEELNKRKAPWSERLDAIHKEFPSTVRLDWVRAFDDLDLLGRIIRDILKVDQSPPGRSGPRPVLDRKKAQARLRQFMGKDYSAEDFPEAFRNLAGVRTHRQLAEKTGLDRNMIQKLLAGTRPPDIYQMEVIAKTFEKHPSYFMEYRVMYVLGALGDQMAMAPEMTVDLYKQLSGRYNR